MTTRREQELLEANHRLTERARAAESRVAAMMSEKTYGRVADIAAAAMREAFKAGWRTNAVNETEENSEHLDSGEEVDWITYCEDGLEKYLKDLSDSAKEIEEENERIFGHGADIVITDEEGNPEMAVTIAGLDDGPHFISASDIKPSHLTFGDIKIDLNTGAVTIPDGVPISIAAREFWKYIQTHILKRRDPLRRFKHVKRGTTYELLGLALVQAAKPVTEDDTVAVYRAEKDNQLYIRPANEFADGRFEELS